MGGTMKVAITYENQEIFQHFGKSPAFLIAEAEGKNIISTEIVPTDGAGHSALIQFLKDRNVNAVVCGGIGQGARDGLENAGMEVISGQKGSAEAALHFYLNGDLKDNPAGRCNHHHGEGGHSCGNHGCGKH